MRFGWLTAIAALFLATPAAAGLTARYAQEGEARPLTIQVGANGDSRMMVAEAVYVRTRGTIYMIMSDAGGEFVVRQEDFLSLMEELLRAAPAAGPPPSAGRTMIAEAGRETVGGRVGTRFLLSLSGAPSDTIDAVLSTDPELAPLGRAMAHQMPPFFATMGRAIPGFGEAMAELMARGTLIRLATLWRLESVESGPIPDSAFAVPSAPIDREALAARFGVRRAD